MTAIGKSARICETCSDRNMGLWPVCFAEIFSAARDAAGYKPTGRTECKSMFLSRCSLFSVHQLDGYG